MSSVSSPAAVTPMKSTLLPLEIGLFCLLWRFAFVAGKIGVTYCPPLLLLAARFSLAGVLILLVPVIRGELRMGFRDAAV
ncbi:MAG: EamA/RhaT family transporter, partial [Bradyrhizobium sp.]|nr:EamA/RhaT family transporter [Bradyrhizobium sp.]